MKLIGSPFVIGWAKPVPINYSMLKRKKAGLFMVAIAGVTANFFNILVSATLLKFMSPLKVREIIAYTINGVNVNLLNIQNSQMI